VGTTYDRIENKNGTVTIGSATAKLNWGAFVPAIGDCFRIVDGQTTNVGLRSGEFVVITSSNPAINFDVDYSDLAEVEICVTGFTLPVEMTVFKGRLDNGKTFLTWETASEINNDYFEVEHNTDGRTFTMLDKVQGNGTTSNTNKYEYLDKNPASNDNYYRLKQVDFDGAFEYSDRAAATLTFYDFYGRKVIQETTAESASIDISQLEVGVYMIEILNNSNEKKYVKIFIQ